MGGTECLLRVGVLGINFKTADLALREDVARSTVGLTGEAGLFFAHRTVVLSTCNRTEIYFSAPDLAEAHSDLLQFFRLRNSSFEHRLYSYFGIDCVAHLCRVSAGLDSAIVAETEIQRQVKCAYQASAVNHLPSGMHFLFQKALKVGKEVRTNLPLARGSSTLPGVLVDLIGRHGVDLKQAKILFVGHSQLNRSLIAALKRKGMGDIHLCTRHPEGGGDRAVFFGREILSRWDDYDLLICASKSSSYLLHPKEVSSKPRLIFDLSVPRNVDPLAGFLPQVTLYNIEQIDHLVEQNRFAQQEHLDRCEALIREHVGRLCSSYRRKLQVVGIC